MKMELENLLDKIEGEVMGGNYNLKELGFWKTVSEIKKNPALIQKFAEQIGRIDLQAFKSKTRFTLNIAAGHALEVFGVILGIILLAAGRTNPILLVPSALILMTALHPLAHYFVGRSYGINFSFYFLNGPMLIEPTLKTDYATYLKAPARARAIMHFAGVANSIVVTFLVFVLGIIFSAPAGIKILLGIIFIFTALSEVVPVILIKIGIKKILFADFRKSDSYRTLREWK